MKDLEDYIANGKKNENRDIQQMAANFTANEEDAVKLFKNLKKSFGARKMT